MEDYISLFALVKLAAIENMRDGQNHAHNGLFHEIVQTFRLHFSSLFAEEIIVFTQIFKHVFIDDFFFKLTCFFSALYAEKKYHLNNALHINTIDQSWHP